RGLPDLLVAARAARKIAGVDGYVREVQQQLPALAVIVEQSDRTRQQILRRRCVDSAQRSQSCRAQMLGGLGRQGARQLIGQSELAAVPMRLLEVVADDLFVLEEPLARNVLKPGSEAGMQIGPLLLREGAIGGVANQDVAESEGLVTGRAGSVWAHQLLAHQRHEPGTQLVTAIRG